MTDARRSPHPRSAAEALAAVESLLAHPGVVLLTDYGQVVRTWIELCRHHPVRGGRIFDLQLVATMLAHGVRRICTFDQADFDRFEELEVLRP